MTAPRRPRAVTLQLVKQAAGIAPKPAALPNPLPLAELVRLARAQALVRL